MLIVWPPGIAILMDGGFFYVILFVILTGGIIGWY
jgi:hypothetical protein